MHHIQTTVTTPKAAAYVAQLAKHFSHKIEVEQNGDLTVFHFSFGTGQIDISGDQLTLTAAAETPDQMAKLAHVMGSHLERFAFRENLSLVWPEHVTTTESEKS
ncbi:DUF2218 domain-containing protein [Halocynthiibacter sp.]|uniref:DUF2218 domain-containing protein n=1 Tax=Halocynthiibacter sp. TaxID=1979210 RepID=UPI003C4CB21B